MSFTDLDELLEPWLDLPIRGKTYRIHSVDAHTGLYCQKVAELSAVMAAGGEISEADAESLKLDDAQERDFIRRLLGDTLDELTADGIPWEHIRFVNRVVFVWTAHGRPAAERLWERGGHPEGPRPAAKKTPAKKAKKKSAPPA